MLLAESDDETDVYVTSYFQSHPSIRFMERVLEQRFSYKSIETTDHLPLNWTPGKAVSLIVDSRSRPIFDEAAYFYPDADLQEIQPPFGGPVVVSHAKLSVDDIASVQGLNAAYYANADWSGEPLQTRNDALINFDWSDGLPLEPPFSIEWRGVLKVRTYGPHRFAVQGPGRSQLYIGEEAVLQEENGSSETFMLAQGNHELRLRTSVTNSDTLGMFQLIWHPPDSGVEVVPNHALYIEPMTSNGLLGNYYANGEWAGPATLQRVDPQINIYFHLTPLPRPYTVLWEGKIAAPVTGVYKFGLESIDESELWINGALLVRADRPNDLVNADIPLTAGLHDVEIRFADYTDHTHINFYWMPPGGGGQRKVPSSALFPPRGNYERIELPAASELGLVLYDPNADADMALYRAAETEILVTDLNSPKGIAVGPDGTIYVSDTGNQQVLLFDPDGEKIATISEGSAPFDEPFDLAVDTSNAPLGELIVGDSKRAALDIFDAKGNYLSTVPSDAALLGYSRGLDVDLQGRIWIAATTANRAVALDREGKRLTEYVVGRDKITQPTDVLIGEDGSLFVAEAEQHILVRFGPDGRLQLTRDLPIASSVESAHMALVPAAIGEDSQVEADEDALPRGYLYITEPEKAQITIRNHLGEQIGILALLPTEEGAVRKPVGIAVDGEGRILVTDSAHGEVLRLTLIE